MTSRTVADEWLQKLILDRRAECGIGLRGSTQAIANWLFREHNVVTSTATIQRVLDDHRTRDYAEDVL